MKKDNHIDRKKIIGVILGILTIFRIIMLSKEAVYLHNSPHDDDLMVYMAMNLDSGEWLGKYSQFTLLKGVSFPIFLVMIHRLGIPYIVAVVMFYIAACAVFIYALRPVVKSDITRAICYILLLFNPGLGSMGGLQRVYLSTIVGPLCLLIFAGVFSMFVFHDNLRKMIKWSLLTSISLAFLWQTKDDAIWIIPFVIVAMIVTIVLAVKKFGKTQKSILAVIICLLPFTMISFFNIAISTINYTKYDTYVTREIDEGNYADLISKMYSVKDDDDIDYVSVSRNKLDTLYSISPTLALIKDSIDNQMQYWDRFDRNPGDGEVEDGWFMFMLRDAMADSGLYNDARMMNMFCQKVIDEIDGAATDNEIEMENSFLSKARLSPWKASYTGKIPSTLLDLFVYTIKYEDCEPAEYSPTEYNEKQKYERFLYSTAKFNNNEYYNVNENRPISIVCKIYSVVSPVLFIISFIIFAWKLINSIFMRKKRQKKSDGRLLLLQTGIFLSWLVLLGGLTYTQLTAFDVHNSTYFVAGYILNIMFICISFATCFDAKNICDTQDGTE